VRQAAWQRRGELARAYHCPPQQATGFRAGAIRQRRALGERMLIAKVDASTSVGGPGRWVPSHSRQIGHRGAAPDFLFSPLMGSPGLSTLGCDLRRRDASVVVNGSAGDRRSPPRAPPGRSRGLARARDSQTMEGSPSLREGTGDVACPAARRDGSDERSRRTRNPRPTRLQVVQSFNLVVQMTGSG
jgi:hypothetical protein